MATDFLDANSILRRIAAAIGEIEKQIGYKIICGAAGGSYSLGLQNASSDVDCYMIIDCEESSDVIHVNKEMDILGKTIAVDFMCVAYQDIIQEIKIYLEKDKKYPTVFFRTEQEEKANAGKKDVCRPDFKRSVLFRVLLSDEVLRLEEFKKNHEDFKEGIRIVDIIDYQFTRIYGNYMGNVKDKGFVPVRKYLYILHEICTCECLMRSPCKPPMHLLDLADCATLDTVLKSKLVNLYLQNRKAVKEKEAVLTCKDMELNEFIREKLSEIACYLHNNALFEGKLCV